MAEDCHSYKTPNVVRKDFLSESTTKPGTEAVQPLVRQPDEDVDLHIPDEQLSIKSDAAAENRQTISIRPRDNCDTYAIAYICHDHITYATTTVATIVASNSSHNDDLNLAGCGASENGSDTSVFIQNDSTAHTETRDPNPMYTQSTMGPPPNDVTPNPMYTQSTTNPPPNDATPNPMYTQSTMDPPPNEVNPNPMYLQNITEPDVSDGNPCTQPAVDTRQQEDEVTFMSANNDANQRLQPYAASQQQDDDEGSASEIANIARSPCLRPYAVKCLKPFIKSTVESASCDATQPYAVRYQEEIAESANNDSDPYIQPYAVGYQEDDNPPIQSPDCGPAVSASINNDVMANPSSSAGNPTDLVSEERQNVPNALNPNPMYVPNVQHPAACGNPTAKAGRDSGFPWMLQFCPHTARRLQQLTAHSLTGCRSFVPTPPAVSNSSQRKGNHDKKLEIITFGGYGGGPGKFSYPTGVAVSADNEIFVVDTSNKRVQVFSITGTYLRNFPTEVPGKDKMLPYTVAIGVEPDYLWVAGIIKRSTQQCIHVVQYHKEGQPLKNFDLRNCMKYLPSPEIAIDVRNNKVILGVRDMIMMFQPNGSIVRSFRVITDRLAFPIIGVASDCEGNVVLGDWDGRIEVYNHFGNKIHVLEFLGTSGKYGGISVDPLGRIIVANTLDNRVDLFTSRGKFVRAVVNPKNPRYIAVGPDGQLVVANTIDSTVTIFPSHVLFS
uniref:SMP-30/Gluconolactonase/LRE-like region domain-containing protein n=1 Tax=Branchiostoma floridae TaxID=7739 RepID=C3Z079_BRAFL|eukprot:XP_002598126.1 hypothetical protein BRAFLDRAFT_85656 [Branchiostoma floridae]